MNPTVSEITFKLFGSKKVNTAHAILKRKVVGVFTFSIESIGEKRLLRARGTSILPQYRKMGIGTGLWEYVFKHTNPTAIEVYTVSPGGEALVEGLRRKYPNLDWMK